MTGSFSSTAAACALTCAACACLLAGCGISAPFTTKGDKPAHSQVYQNENFHADETFSRLFDSRVEETCEAARRALLSQGYLITDTPKGRITGRKHFQPEGDVHVEISFNVVCVPDGQGDALTTAFVSAQQDRYSLKKTPNSSSIGVSAIGSISLPLSSSDDSLVKVASETIPAGAFYDRFFALMQRQLGDRAADK
ncbi:DUF2242 domain-containing protein [Paucibacter sp. TC2R-5]|uniref:DUF2242 domain-containing protein n=1 Tax=Paucibacter sp. TC2R-5 TaxID=2893555 RepID=UPI0021E3D6CF|nr:DUF2242 domain-containing protein [Paucibacter sp. TC2R-5]MCV2358543.1 DUF2242 domain-containing protein [Paucibacter sp. TC2R-5]